MANYTLYLDESETFDEDPVTRIRSNKVFSIAGVIIENNIYDTKIKSELNAIKTKIWSDLPNPLDVILHEKDVKGAHRTKKFKPRFKAIELSKINPVFHRFIQNSYMSLLYTELDNLFANNPLTVIGTCISIDKLHLHYSECLLSDRYLIALQMICENFVHFLKTNNGTGTICLESRGEGPDRNVKMRFSHINAMGTMYINAFAMQKYIEQFVFCDKLSNSAGLQIADFVPNSFARVCGGKNNFTYNIYQSLRKSRYDGCMKKYDRFGIKNLP